MKKTLKTRSLKKSKRYEGVWDTPKINRHEKILDAAPLQQDIPEEFRETLPNNLPQDQNSTANWSAPEDRGEDLANMRDPFMQQPERDTEIPPELIQERAYHLYEQRGGTSQDSLADWLEAERQLRSERKE